MEYEIRLIEKAAMFSILPLLELAYPKISKDILGERLKDMLTKDYECVGVYDGEKLIGISGIWTLTKFYVGKHLEPDNVFVLLEYQGKGIGKLMMDWIFEYAKSLGYDALELNCYVHNENGHQFWLKQGYEQIGRHYQKQL